MFGQGSARFRTTDFFGIVLPGFFLLLQIALLIGVFQDWFVQISGNADAIGKVWAPSLVLVLFVSYIIGSVFRTWAIDDTDALCAALFPGSLDYRRTDPVFPYRERLRWCKDVVCMSLSMYELARIFHLGTKGGSKEAALRDYVPPFGLARSEEEQKKAPWSKEPGWVSVTDQEPWKHADAPDWRDGLLIYNSWKATLCVNTPSGFEFAEASEARTRFFFGMLWAARWSLRLMAFTASVLWAREASWSWHVYLVVLVGLALVALEMLRPLRPAGKWLVKHKLGRMKSGGGWLAKSAFWAAIIIELGLTPLFFFWAEDSACVSVGGLIVIGLLVIVATLLFVFLATKLRQVRAREMRAVYFNYVAFVLASYATAPST
jgi:hypothetical protein